MSMTENPFQILHFGKQEKPKMGLIFGIVHGVKGVQDGT